MSEAQEALSPIQKWQSTTCHYWEIVNDLDDREQLGKDQKTSCSALLCLTTLEKFIRSY